MKEETKRWLWQTVVSAGVVVFGVQELFGKGWHETAIGLLLLCLLVAYLAGSVEEERDTYEEQRDLLTEHWPDYYPQPRWDDE